MESLLWVAEAAERLDVSPRRVRQLIDRGELEASRVGRAWMIQPSSVERRRLQPTAAGRPLDSKRVWSSALLADQLVEQLKRQVDAHGPGELSRHLEMELARRLEQPLRYLMGADPRELASGRRKRAEAERAFREGLSALRDFRRREQAIDAYAPALFEMGAEEPSKEDVQPKLFELDERDERAAIRKLRNSLAHGDVGPEKLAAFRSRSDGVDGYYGHASVLSALASDERLVLSGPHAAYRYGADIVPGDEVDGYVNAENADPLAMEHGLEDAPLGQANVWLRPVGALPISGGLAPRLFVAADLLERTDPRRREAASQLLEALVAAIRWHEAG
jgi:excisionase family DNA binding protein